MNPKSLPYLIIGCIITFWCNSANAQVPTLQLSNNPTTCHGSEGSITFSALTANATYQISYVDDGVTIGPVTFVANGAGQIKNHKGDLWIYFASRLYDEERN